MCALPPPFLAPKQQAYTGRDRQTANSNCAVEKPALISSPPASPPERRQRGVCRARPLCGSARHTRRRIYKCTLCAAGTYGPRISMAYVQAALADMASAWQGQHAGSKQTDIAMCWEQERSTCDTAEPRLHAPLHFLPTQAPGCANATQAPCPSSKSPGAQARDVRAGRRAQSMRAAQCATGGAWLVQVCWKQGATERLADLPQRSGAREQPAGRGPQRQQAQAALVLRGAVRLAAAGALRGGRRGAACVRTALARRRACLPVLAPQRLAALCARRRSVSARARWDRRCWRRGASAPARRARRRAGRAGVRHAARARPPPKVQSTRAPASGPISTG
jgi:hypothetical protein